MLSARAVLQKLARAGFRILYIKGSHYYLKHPITKRITSIPMHGGKDIDRGLLSKIIKQAGLLVKEFIEL